ncbi:MAG: S41 family peptidase [Rhodothermales bacterium]|jgi:carboxyl-terminal processing protease
MTSIHGRFLVGTVLVGALAVFLTGFRQPDDDIFFSIKKNLTIFGSLYEELAVGYVDPVDPERLMRTGLESMLNTLDPYTVFIDEATNEDIDIATRGRYAGVGLTVAMQQGAITVVTPIEGYSGFRQGVRAGDVVIEVAGRNVTGLTPSEVGELFRGDPGTTVNLVVEREGEIRPIEFVLTRELVRLKNVTYAGLLPDSRIGYLKLERFARDAYAELLEGVHELQSQGQIDGLIIDLRDNPGGLLEAAVDISGMFVPQGTEIVSTRGRLPQTHRAYRSRRAPVMPDVPLAVLVNGNSASASEIVAGALQDLDRAVIVGDRTFGKGLVQIIRPLPYNTSLKMTTSKYYTPSGRSIQAITYTHRVEDGYAVAVADSLQKVYLTASGRTVKGGGGIEPDVSIPVPDRSDLEEALIRKSAFFRFANAFAATHTSIPEDFVVTDAILKDFRSWLDADSFTYESRTEALLGQLADEAGAAGYDLKKEVSTVEKSLASQKDLAFGRYQSQLKEELRKEILARYFGETALIRASLAHDVQVKRAVKALSDPTSLRNTLQGR